MFDGVLRAFACMKKEVGMKKKVLALATAMAISMGLPTMAFAAQYNSPSGTTATDSNGISLTVSGGTVFGDGFIHVDPVSNAASNVPEGAKVLATFHVWGDEGVEFDKLTLTFKVGSQYAGKTVTMYIQYDDGTSEVKEAVVEPDGTITIEVTKACTLSLVVDEIIAPTEGQGGVTVTGVKVDSSSKSPQTGAGMGVAAGVTVAMAAGAGAPAFALRKRLSE